MNFTYSLFIVLMVCQVILGQVCPDDKIKKACTKRKGVCVKKCQESSEFKCKKQWCKGKNCECKYKAKKPASCKPTEACTKLKGTCVSKMDCVIDEATGAKCNGKACAGKKCTCSFTKVMTKAPVVSPSDDD